MCYNDDPMRGRIQIYPSESIDICDLIKDDPTNGLILLDNNLTYVYSSSNNKTSITKSLLLKRSSIKEIFI